MTPHGRFTQEIREAAPSAADFRRRRWVYVPYDRYTDRTGPLTEQPAEETGIVIVESTAKAHRRPYHKKKLVLLISNMRHFALEQAARGVCVLYHFAPESHGQALLALQRRRKLPRFTVMRPAERELRLDLGAAAEGGLDFEEVTDTTWLTQHDDFTGVYGEQLAGSYVMDRFYRAMRQKTGILMQNAKPVGGKFSFDESNRRPYRGEVAIPQMPASSPDALTEEVIDYVGATYAHHFGSIAGFDLPCSQAGADAMWTFALEHLLPHFGPYEDAMRDDHRQLFHSKTSPLLNLARLLPRQLVEDVARKADEGVISLASAEGFIRQMLGWREFMRHIHEVTDGYRAVEVPGQAETRPQERSPDADETQDPYVAPKASIACSAMTTEATGAQSHRRQREGAETKRARTGQAAARGSPIDPYAGATPSALGATLPLPAVYWGAKSGLHCMDTVVTQVIEEGWSHHTTRLMVLSNLATLCGFSPRELTDWFWFGYIDAYDWVVETNVLGMSTYADGGLTATKPYVSGAAYINRMSNYCGHCRYDPKKSLGDEACPFTALYWTFLARNEERLAGNFRMKMPYSTLRRKPAGELVQLRERAEKAVAALLAAERPRY